MIEAVVVGAVVGVAALINHACRLLPGPEKDLPEEERERHRIPSVAAVRRIAREEIEGWHREHYGRPVVADIQNAQETFNGLPPEEQARIHSARFAERHAAEEWPFTWEDVDALLRLGYGDAGSDDPNYRGQAIFVADRIAARLPPRDS